MDRLPRDEILRRLQDARQGLLAVARRLGDDAIRGDAAWGWVHMTLHGHYLDHLAVIEPWTEQLRRARSTATRSSTTRAPTTRMPSTARARPTIDDLDMLLAAVPQDRWDTDEITDGWTCATTWAISPTGHGGRPGHRYLSPSRPLAGRPRRRHRRLERAMVAESRGESPAETLTRYREATEAMHDAIDTSNRRSCAPRTAGAGPTTRCTATSASTSR